MDRMTPSIRPPKEVTSPLDLDVGMASFSRSLGDWPRTVFVPLHYEPNYAYPLIVWLHGPGNDERQLARIMPMVSLRNYVAVAPRGMAVGAGSDQADVGQYDWLPTWDHIQQASQRVSESIEAVAARYHVAQHRVFLAGFDHGGTMALRIATGNPSRFAGVLSFCGAFPSGRTPLSNLPEVRNMPIFLAVGRDSRSYSPENACEDLRLLHTAGLQTTLRQYPCRHELSPEMLGDMDRWIMDQVTGPHGG